MTAHTRRFKIQRPSEIPSATKTKYPVTYELFRARIQNPILSIEHDHDSYLHFTIDTDTTRSNEYLSGAIEAICWSTRMALVGNHIDGHTFERLRNMTVFFTSNSSNDWEIEPEYWASKLKSIPTRSLNSGNDVHFSIDKAKQQLDLHIEHFSEHFDLNPRTVTEELDHKFFHETGSGPLMSDAGVLENILQMTLRDRPSQVLKRSHDVMRRFVENLTLSGEDFSKYLHEQNLKYEHRENNSRKSFEFLTACYSAKYLSKRYREVVAGIHEGEV